MTDWGRIYFGVAFDNFVMNVGNTSHQITSGISVATTQVAQDTLSSSSDADSSNKIAVIAGAAGGALALLLVIIVVAVTGDINFRLH